MNRCERCRSNCLDIWINQCPQEFDSMNLRAKQSVGTRNITDSISSRCLSYSLSLCLSLSFSPLTCLQLLWVLVSHELLQYRRRYRRLLKSIMTSWWLNECTSWDRRRMSWLDEFTSKAALATLPIEFRVDVCRSRCWRRPSRHCNNVQSRYGWKYMMIFTRPNPTLIDCRANWKYRDVVGVDSKSEQIAPTPCRCPCPCPCPFVSFSLSTMFASMYVWTMTGVLQLRLLLHSIHVAVYGSVFFSA